MTSPIISRASFSSTGESLNETSFISSTKTPPMPNMATAPNCASLTTPVMTSTPLGAICSIMNPSITAIGFSMATERNIWDHLSSSSTASFMPTATPPKSLLCGMSGDIIFMTSGYPISSAASSAPVTSLTTTKRGTGMEQALSISFVSGSVSVFLPRLIASLTILSTAQLSTDAPFRPFAPFNRGGGARPECVYPGEYGGGPCGALRGGEYREPPP